MSLIYTLPSASFLTYMTLSFIFTLVLFHGSSSLFNGQTCLSKTFIFVRKKDPHELASQLMPSPHMHVHPYPKSSNVCAPTLDQTCPFHKGLSVPKEWSSHTNSMTWNIHTGYGKDKHTSEPPIRCSQLHDHSMVTIKSGLPDATTGDHTIIL
jgi:hypothetical protein